MKQAIMLRNTYHPEVVWRITRILSDDVGLSRICEHEAVMLSILKLVLVELGSLPEDPNKSPKNEVDDEELVTLRLVESKLNVDRKSRVCHCGWIWSHDGK